MKNSKSQTVNITISKELLVKVDALAKRDYTSRSDIIRQALLTRIRRPVSDEWGDEGRWETVVDLKDAPAGGMPAYELSARLKALDGQD